MAALENPSLSFALPVDTRAMEARLAQTIPIDTGVWQYEPKWDGFRCLAFKNGDAVELRAKSGKPLGRYFPELVALLRGLEAPEFVVDGEIVIELSGAYSFDALQMRLHPAESRVRKLAAESPARLVLFDMLADVGGHALTDQPLSKRRMTLETFVKSSKPKGIELSPATFDPKEAEAWLKDAGHGKTDGVVAKRRDDPYISGERAMIKVKRMRTADCVVGGFRYLAGRPEIGSLLLGLYDEGRQARPCRLHLDHCQRRQRRPDPTSGGLARSTRLHGQRARRSQPLEHRA
jgi:ATP-dependent DNA ligase